MLTTKVARITQISLTSAFDTSTFKIDGNLVIDNNGSLGDFNNQPRGIDFSPSGLKMYVLMIMMIILMKYLSMI